MKNEIRAVKNKYGKWLCFISGQKGWSARFSTEFDAQDWINRLFSQGFVVAKSSMLHPS